MPEYIGPGTPGLALYTYEYVNEDWPQHTYRGSDFGFSPPDAAERFLKHALHDDKWIWYQLIRITTYLPDAQVDRVTSVRSPKVYRKKVSDAGSA